VLAIITAVDPPVSIGVARVWLGETISNTPLALAGEVVALVVMTVGICVLAHRAPHVVSSHPELSTTASPATE
jgi:drug/metabolite transporter (DMT)-like permease